MFPISGRKNTLELENLTFDDSKTKESDIKSQQVAKEQEKTWGIPVFGEFVLRDKETGNVINKSRQKIAVLPKMTQRFTYIIGGGEYNSAYQQRIKSGIYSKVNEKGEHLAEINLNGRNNAFVKEARLKIPFDLEKKKFNFSYATNNIPLYSMLKCVGVSDEDMKKTWGEDIWKANAKKNWQADIQKMYDKKWKGRGLAVEGDSFEHIQKAVTDALSKSAVLPETTKLTLGRPVEKLNGDILLETSLHVLKTARGEKSPDDMGSMVFKQLLGLDDFIAEKFGSPKTGMTMKQKIRNNVDRKDKVSSIISSDLFSKPLAQVFYSNALSQRPDQTNPLDILASKSQVTSMGPGGITSTHQLRPGMKMVNQTHMGFVDAIMTPESEHTGISLHLPIGVRKIGREAKAYVYDMQEKKFVYRNPAEVHGEWTASPDQITWKNGEPVPVKPSIVAMSPENHEFVETPFSKVRYVIPSPRHLFAESTNAIPFLQCNQGNRTMTGSRQPTQGVSLVHREAPLVQVKSNTKDSFEKVFGSAFSHSAPEDGKIVDIVKDKLGHTDEIHVEDTKGQLHKVQIYNHFPLNEKKTYIHAEPNVSIGDVVKKGQTIADTNFSKAGVLATGINLRTGYVNYFGETYEDSVAISESAAKKLSSTHLHRPTLETNPGDVVSLNKYLAYASSAGKKITKDKLQHLDTDGIIKPGTRVKPGDILVAAVGKNEIPEDLAKLGARLKGAILPYRDKSLVWDNEHEGEVIKVVKKPGETGYSVHVKTVEPMRVGDKLSGRAGDKNIVGAIIPDAHMPRVGGPEGPILDMLTSPTGVVSRINISQMLELGASKIAEKTGKPYITNNFQHGVDYAEKLRQEMKQHGLSDTDVIYDPLLKETLENPVMTGKKYIFKLKHQVEKKESVRGMDQSLARKYSINEDPSRGGGEGAQAIAQLDMYALLAHGARANLKEMTSYKAERQHNSETMADTDFWNRVMLGLPLQPPKATFAYKKFEGMLQGMGLNLKKEGYDTVLTPLTDKGVLHLSAGEITNSKMLRGKDDLEIAGGLFDKKITGGTSGKLHSHISLAEPFPNPLFVGTKAQPGPAVVLSGLKYVDFEKVVHGEKTVNIGGKEITGGKAINELLKKVDVNKEFEKTKEELKHLSGTTLDKANKKAKFLRALKSLNMKPHEAYVMNQFPVIPPIFRPVVPMGDGSIASADINTLYAHIIQDNNALKDKETLKYNPELYQKLNAAVYDKLKAAVGIGSVPLYEGNKELKGLAHSIAGDNPKTGFFQNKIMKRRQDLSMRSTITPAPDLQMDQVGIPRDSAMALYKPFVIRTLIQSGKDLIEATKEVKEQTPMAWKALEHTIKERPVLIKRDPVLHKYNIQAYYPILKEGKSIGLHPLACAAFNSDFDGDSCLGTILIVDNVKFSEYSWYNNTKENTEMPHINNSVLSFRAFDIAEFPRVPGTEKFLSSGTVEYDVPPDIFVPSFSPEGIKILPVTKFSIHSNCEEWVTKTLLERQFITSEDHSLATLDPDTLEVVKTEPRNSIGRCLPTIRSVLDGPYTITHSEGERSESAVANDMIPVVPLNFDTGWFIGATIGDGWVVFDRNRAVCIGFATGTQSDDVRLAWEHLAQYLCPDSKVSNRAMPHEFEGRECMSFRSNVYCSSLARWLAKRIGQGAANKKMPKDYLQMSEEFRRGLFCGLVDTDGTVCWNANNRFAMAVTTISERLCGELCVLALSLGIVPSVTSYINRDKPAYCITFSVRTVQNARWIRLACSYKREALEKLWGMEGKEFGPSDIVPLTEKVKTELKAICRAAGGTREKNKNKSAASVYVVVSRSQGYLTRTIAERILDLIQKEGVEISDYLQKWLSIALCTSVGWDYITEANSTGQVKTMYDITVPETWNFAMADGAILWDTMAVYLPLTEEARKEAIDKMLPSKNLFSSTNYGIMHAPDQESIIGLHLATFWGGKKDKTYNSLQDIVNDKTLHRSDVVKYKIGGVEKETTKGRALLASHLPSEFPQDKKDKLLHDSSFNFKKGSIHDYLETAARLDKKNHPNLVDGWRNIGNETAYKAGFSFSLSDLKPNKELRDKILNPYHAEVAKIRASSLGAQEKDDKAIELYGKATKELEKEFTDYYRNKDNHMHKMVDIKARGNFGQFRQTVIAPMLMADNNGVIPEPVTKSYSEGLSVDQYWKTLYGARMGTLSRAQGTSVPGALAKELSNINVATTVASHDCGTTKGHNLSLIGHDGKEEIDVTDRYLAKDVVHNNLHIKAGTFVTPDLFAKMKNAGVQKVEVRSPLGCKDPVGICQKCIGMSSEGNHHEIGTNIGMLASQALSEPAIQIAMDSFHSGGIATGRGVQSVSALQRAQQLFNLPKTLPNSAVLAKHSGTISRIEKDPSTNGHYIFVKAEKDEHKHYVPPSRDLLVKSGDDISRGDSLSDGVINPRQLLQYKNMDAVRDYLTDQLHKIYKNVGGTRRRNVEVVVKNLTNLTEVHDPGKSEHLTGDILPLNKVQEFNSLAKPEDKIIHSPILRGIKETALLKDEDYLSRMNFQRIQSTLIEGAGKGWKTTTKNTTNPIPAFAASTITPQLDKNKPHY